MKIKWKRAVSIILVMTLMVTFAQWKVYADEEKETTEIVENNLEVVYQEKEYKIIISLKEHWDSGYNANVKIENIGEETIENWYLQWVYEEDITNIWNAEVKSHQDANYIIKNVTWNQDIESGKSIEFGFSGNKSFTGFPKECKLVGDSSEVKKDDYTIQYQLDSDWGDGFTGRVLITNNTEQTLEDWVLEMDFARQITNIWDGKIKLHEENHYIIQNAGYNSNIMAGQTISFGFNGINGKRKWSRKHIICIHIMMKLNNIRRFILNLILIRMELRIYQRIKLWKQVNICRNQNKIHKKMDMFFGMEYRCKWR